MSSITLNNKAILTTEFIESSFVKNLSIIGCNWKDWDSEFELEVLTLFCTAYWSKSYMFGFELEDCKRMFESKVTSELLLGRRTFRLKYIFATENQTCLCIHLIDYLILLSRRQSKNLTAKLQEFTSEWRILTRCRRSKNGGILITWYFGFLWSRTIAAH